ncbi:hypothetical protein [Nocardioides sp. R-C-SC26]|uniref:hypothetical protein n=1 Tax=Nocardioides sp. R-C-SC26 TaxID=2870414 RepID=UPI001E460329|nr:hypothetical protein [Nocardioides sp. R-C-SC26]
MARRRVARPPRDEGLTPWPFVGMVLMASAFFLYAASGLVAPAWAVVALMVVWVALFALCCLWWTPHPRRLVWVAVGSMLFWFVSLNAGAYFLDWQA